MERFGQITALVLAGSLLAGCSIARLEPGFLIKSKRIEKVAEAADWYAQSIRWGRLDAASGMVREEDRQAFVERFVWRAEGLKFTAAQILHVDLGDDPLTADVWVQYEYYRPPHLREKRVQEHQVWHYEANFGNWLVEPELDAFPFSVPPAVSSGPGPGSGHPASSR